MLEGSHLKIPLSLTENNRKLGFKAIFFNQSGAYFMKIFI